MMELGRGGACVPARAAPQGRIHRSRPRGMMRDAQNQIPVWKRRYGDIRAGTQAPPLRFRLSRLRVDCWFHLAGLRVGQLVSFGKEIWPSTIFSCFDFPSTGKHDFAAPRNRLNHASFGLEDGIDGREKHRKNGDIDAQHH